MTDPRFLTLDEVLTIHATILAKYGGSEGVLNGSLLESALASPQASYGGRFLNAFPFEMAAACMIGLAKNHAFADGNKRTSSMVVSTFLRLNGFKLKLSNEEFEAIVLAVATGEMKKAKLTEVLTEASAKA
jgi:death-on-curing protein